MQYLEQKAKDQYIKTIVSDDAPNINAEDNERLAIANEQKKEKLRIAKAQLAEKDSDIRTLAPLVEQGASHTTLTRLPPRSPYNRLQQSQGTHIRSVRPRPQDPRRAVAAHAPAASTPTTAAHRRVRERAARRAGGGDAEAGRRAAGPDRDDRRGEG